MSPNPAAKKIGNCYSLTEGKLVRTAAALRTEKPSISATLSVLNGPPNQKKNDSLDYNGGAAYRHLSAY